MSAVGLRRWKLASLGARLGYLASMVIIGIICLNFYWVQSIQNQEIDSTQKLLQHFSIVDNKMARFSEKALKISESQPLEIDNPSLRKALAGKSFKERKAYLASLPVDDDIISQQKALKFLQGDVVYHQKMLQGIWDRTTPAIRNRITDASRFMKADTPFKQHADLLNPAKISSARTKSDIYWVSREINGNYTSLVAPSNKDAESILQETLVELSMQQSNLLQKFLLFTIGALVALTMLVFIPLDIYLHRIIGRLAAQTGLAKEALAKAETADRAKSEFLANMSHEIRTPMNGVMGMAELLAKTSLDAKQKMFTDVIVKSGAALLTIINDILDFSKIDAGQLKIDPAPFNLRDAVEDVATLVSTGVAEKDLELVVRIDPSLPQILVGDVGRIRQIITNLVGNAVKFTDTGHVYIEVSGNGSRTSGDAPTAELHFRIEDTGIGIPIEKQEKIFQKFSQVDESATRRHEGTGLGLAIASALIELMGGKIGVESTPGKGSTFWFTISIPVHSDSKTATTTPTDVTGSRILVVDDNSINRSILAEQMLSWQFDSVSCSSGAEALARLQQAQDNQVRYDAIILDYHMPEMDGGSVARAIRADAQLAGIPIIMLTSVDHMDNGKLFSSLDIQAHLIKPARASLLLETIIDVLQTDAARPAKREAGITSSRLRSKEHPVGAESDQSPDIGAQGSLSSDATPIDILVAEDNEVNRLVFTQILLATGYSFLIAEDGEEAVEMYKRHQPKLICMDVSMPKMNGLEATRAIRKLEQDKDQHVPIIGVTAHVIKGDMENCLEAGMDDYLPKPVSPDMLEAKIDTWINTEKAAASG